MRSLSTLHSHISIVRSSINRDGMHIPIKNRGHLSLL